jgi:imidazole glycerol-phosphate synthase subunit HisH
MNVIVDYGVGNIGSIANMLKRLGVPSLITARPEDIESANRIILCGVGAFDDGMKKLENLGITASLRKAVLEDKKPIIGVCLGMQLLTEGSEEGNKQGLGFVKGYCKRFDFSSVTNSGHLKIPHMGWNEVKAVKQSLLMKEMYAHPRFYFVHSYHVVLQEENDALLTARYGYDFTAAFEQENIIGVQFHPEKSHKYGLKLYENFVKTGV